jgi:hypothetical protein
MMLHINKKHTQGLLIVFIKHSYIIFLFKGLYKDLIKISNLVQNVNTINNNYSAGNGNIYITISCWPSPETFLTSKNTIHKNRCKIRF